MAAVEITPEAAKQYAELPRTIQARMAQLRLRLESWPEISGARPLSGDLAGHWRLRTGDYRLQFCVERERVIIEKIGHRDGFYEE